MFTGLIEEIGRLERIIPRSAGLEMKISAQSVLDGLKTGDSIAVSGPCLTVIEVFAGGFKVEAVRETIDNTTIGTWRSGKSLNLERALAAGGRFGGHIVQGHIDGLGSVKTVSRAHLDTIIEVETSPEIARYLVHKGSIALDGVSLTIAEVEGERFKVAVIPHTLKHTTLNELKPGDKINLETDILAKYVEKFTAGYKNTGTLTEQKLREAGF